MIDMPYFLVNVEPCQIRESYSKVHQIRNQRIIQIDELIKKHTYPSLKKLGKKLGISEKTAWRYIKFMKDELKAPVGSCKLNRGYYYTDPSYTLPVLKLTTGEILAILIGEKLLSQYENTPYEARLRNSFIQLQKYLPCDIQMENIGKFIHSCSFDFTFMRKVNIDTFEFLINAIADKEQIEIHYHTMHSDEKKWRTIDPYHLKNYRGEWYLASYCHKAKDIRIFSPGRIIDWRKTGKFFSVKEDFSPEEFWKTYGIYKGNKKETKDITVWIDPYQSRWTREIISDINEQIIDVKNHNDRSMTLVFRVGKTDELKRWILQYGFHIKVLKPEDFKREIIEEIEKMRKNYE